jgi:dolichyl-diphosphooligosaccharide--protein glycosyltransferase
MGNQVVEEDFYKEISKFKVPALLLGIFLIGFSIVYLPHGPRLSDPDAWHYYRFVKWIIDDGGLPEIDPLQYYPTGGHPRSDNIVHSYLIAYTYRLVKPLGIDLMSYLMLFPAVFGGGLAAVMLYFAVKELFGRKTGLLAGLFYSFMPLMLTRVYAGTIDKEVVYGLFVFTTLYLFLKSYRLEITLSNPRTLILPVLSGIFFALAYASWRGGAYIILVISSSALIYYFHKRDLNLMKALLIMSLVAPLTMHAIQPQVYTFSYFLPNLNIAFPLAVSSLPLFSLMASDELKRRYGREVHFLKIMVLFLVGVLGVLVLLGKGSLLLNYFRSAFSILTLQQGVHKDIYMGTVAESQPSIFLGSGNTLAEKVAHGDFYFNLRLMLLILPFGIFLLLKKIKEKKGYPYVLALIWIVSGFIAAMQGKRLLFFLAPSAAVITAYTFTYVHDYLRAREEAYHKALKKLSRGKGKYVTESKRTNIVVAYLSAAVIIFGVTLSTLDFAVATMGSRQSDLPTPWYRALMWTKDNTPPDSVVVFWWDYGYFFQAVAERRTVADGGGNVPRNSLLANMFTSPEDEALKYLRRLVDYEKVPTYMVVSYEEFGKSGAINRIASTDPDNPSRVKKTDGQLYIGSFRLPKSGNIKDDQTKLEEIFKKNKITTYYILNTRKNYIVWVLVQVDKNGQYRPEWGEKLLVKLLPFNTGLGQGLKHFNLVYTDPWNYIFIYRVK